MSALPEVASTRNGLATLGPAGLALLAALQRMFGELAAQSRAVAVRFPPLLRVEDLDALDYFRNFPHLGLAAAPLAPDVLTSLVKAGETRRELPSHQLDAARHLLPSAACYCVYAHLQASTVQGPMFVTTTASCFRNETAYEGLERLWAFTMQEIVCLGTMEQTRAHIEDSLTAIRNIASQLGVTLGVETATDPFFDRKSSVALLQERAPTKRELIFEGLAVGSVNFHRNFFGDRFAIRDGEGRPVFSSCVAFGLERWIHMLLRVFAGDAAAATRAVAAVRVEEAVASA